MRINISIPDDLKTRMDEADDVNWSSVARSAFEAKLLQINAQKDDATMEDVAARLRSTRKSTQEKGESEGRQLGREWAKTTATLDELEALAEAESDTYGIFAGEPMAPYGRLDIVFMTARRWDDDVDGRCDEAEDWWRDDVGGRRDPSESVLRGFVDGALEVLSEVGGSI